MRISADMNIRRFFRSMTYRFRMYFIERPSVVKIRHKELSPFQWVDRDTRLLFAAFQILQDFVEQEETLESLMIKVNNPDPEWPHHVEYDKEILALYLWWTVDRPNRKDPFGEEFVGQKRISNDTHMLALTPEYSAYLRKAGEEEDRRYQEDTDMLVRLMKVRGALWT